MGLQRRNHGEVGLQGRRVGAAEDQAVFRVQKGGVGKTLDAQGMVLSRRDGLGAEAGQGQGVEIRVLKRRFRAAQDIPHKARANDRGRESGSEVQRGAERALDSVDLMGGEAPSDESLVIDARGVRQGASADDMAPRRRDIRAHSLQARDRGGVHRRQDFAIGRLGPLRRTLPGGAVEGEAAQA